MDLSVSLNHIFSTLKTNDRAKRTPPTTGDELRCSRWVRSFCSTSCIRRSYYSSYKKDDVMNKERTVNRLRQVEHILGQLWHRYSVTANQVMVAPVKRSKWWFQLKQ